MTSTTSDYLDDNAAKREWSRIFAEDITSPEGRCAHHGAIRRFADARMVCRVRVSWHGRSVPTRSLALLLLIHRNATSDAYSSHGV
jgi:hypothetical protein